MQKKRKINKKENVFRKQKNERNKERKKERTKERKNERKKDMSVAEQLKCMSGKMELKGKNF